MISFGRIIQKSLLCFAVGVTANCAMPLTGNAHNLLLSQAERPVQAMLNVEGQGLAPNQDVTLSTGPNQQLSARSTNTGTFAFQNLKYVPSSNLVFSLSFKAGSGTKLVPNTLLLNLDPFTGTVQVQGSATKAASIIVNVSSEDSKAMIANEKGYFSGRADSLSGFSDGQIRVVTSIINVDQECCPRTIRPFTPAMIVISSQPMQKASADLIKGSFSAEFSTETKSRSYGAAVSVPPALINNSWINGFIKFGNTVANDITAQTTALGSFMNAENQASALRALQRGAAAGAINSLPSEALCRFGTLSESLVASEAVAEANKLALAQALQGNEGGTANSLSGSGDPLEQRLHQFTTVYCDPYDQNSALQKVCKANKDDTRYNFDVDYTRAVDVPLTLDIDFTNSTKEPAEEDVLTMAENLFPSQPLHQTFTSARYMQNSTLYRSYQAVRTLAKNTFIGIVAEKSKGNAGSSAYIVKLFEMLGLPAGQAQSLIGSNPSYYAQMDALTKRLFQDPGFYINLVDTPANVERQKVAILALKLQQQNDLAQTIKRREMLLSVLLELKLRERAKMVNQRMGVSGEQ